MVTRGNFVSSIKRLATLSSSDKEWVASEVVQNLTLKELSALDDFVAYAGALRKAQRAQVSVFLSHSSKDKRFVRPLAAYLESCGITVWLDEIELLGGHALVSQLAEGVANSSLLLLVLSENSAASAWVKKELMWALSKEIDTNECKVIPILKDNVGIPAYLRDKLCLDFRPSKRASSRPKLVRAIANSV